jgi:hypothetical protein
VSLTPKREKLSRFGKGRTQPLAAFSKPTHHRTRTRTCSRDLMLYLHLKVPANVACPLGCA